MSTYLFPAAADDTLAAFAGSIRERTGRSPEYWRNVAAHHAASLALNAAAADAARRAFAVTHNAADRRAARAAARAAVVAYHGAQVAERALARLASR